MTASSLNIKSASKLKSFANALRTDPSGTVKDVVDDTAEVTTKRGSKIHKDGTEDNPAVVLKTGSGSDAVKRVRLAVEWAKARYRADRISFHCSASLCTQQANEIDGVKP